MEMSLLLILTFFEIGSKSLSFVIIFLLIFIINFFVVPISFDKISFVISVLKYGSKFFYQTQ